jgi:pimeloyl-ACP methyl ester carboxylesterase
MQRFLSPRLQSNARGAGGSDDRSWWHALVSAGFPVFAYSQRPGLLLPLERGPVAECLRFMELLRRDVLGEPDYRERQVVIVGHSRGGLIGRAILSDPTAKAAGGDTFPNVQGLITIAAPHQGSHMALVDDVLLGVLDTLQDLIPDLPNDVGDELIETLKTKIDNYVGAHGDEIEPESAFFQALEAREPIRAGVRCLSVGGTLPRLFRIYLWAFTASSWLPRWSGGGKLVFHWQAKPIEARGASPFPDGLPLERLGLDPSEIIPGRGDGLTADKRCRFPDSFQVEEHLSFPVSHAEELWDRALQTEIVQRLDTFR